MKLTISSDCISCGECVKVCPSLIIGMKENRPTLIGENCITCGHCEAICPTHALNHSLLNHNQNVEMKEPNLEAEKAEVFLRSRRSIRCFKNKVVTKEETKRLLTIGTYAQTARNSQGVSYMVVASKEKMEGLRNIMLAHIKSMKNEEGEKLYQLFSNPDHDVLFRGAPMCIFALTDKNHPYGSRNAQFALTYIELMAPTLGLGTCWAGYLERFLFEDTKELHDLFEIPLNLRVTGALLYGYPKYKYHRLTQRDELVMEMKY